MDNRTRKALRVSLGTWNQVIGECHIRAYKNIVSHGDSVPELYSGFDGNPVAYVDIIFNENVGTDIAICPYAGALQDDAELPYVSSLTYVLCLHIC